MAAERRRAEPWAIGVTLLFVALIAVCVGFWTIAESHADEELAIESVQRVLESRTGSGDDDE